MVSALYVGGCDPQKIAKLDQADSVSEKVQKARKRNDGPAMWKVTDANSTVYLYGSVHLLKDNTDWQKRDLDAALAEVGTVYFEVPDTDKANMEASVLQRQYGLYDSGERLSDHLDSAVKKHLAAAAYNIGLTPERLDIFKPWLVTDMLSLAGAENAGFLAANSVDAALRAQARAARKDIRALESMKDTIEAVALLSPQLQLQSLEDTVRGFDAYGSDLETVTNAWIVGNAELLETEMLIPAKAKSAEMYAILFTNRNIAWAKKMDQFLQGDETALVVVGIGHLLGEGGLPNRLKELGYDVERVRRFDLPND